MNLLGSLHLNHLKTFGHSMLPLLHDGDIVYYTRARFGSLKENDIILAKKGRIYITHRIIYKSPKYLITKGDNNSYSDGKIYSRDVVGRVYQIKRGKEIFPVESLSLFQNASYLQEIGRITDLFQKSTINFVFLKGLPIYLYYTKETPKRIYADCDILVLEKDYPKAKNLLATSGFRRREFVGLLSEFLSPHLMEEDFFKANNGYPVTIDLHKRPFSYIRKLDFPDSLYPKKLMNRFTDDLLGSKRWVMVNGIKIPIPGKDHLLLFLSIHFFTHTMKMVHRLWLMKEVIKKDRKTRKSWDSFLAQCRDYKMGFMVYPAFYFINRLYSRIIPSSILQMMKPIGAEKKYELKTNSIFDERVDLGRILNKIHISWSFSPQPLYRRIFLVVSPSLLLLFLTYLRPIRFLMWANIRGFIKKNFSRAIS